MHVLVDHTTILRERDEKHAVRELNKVLQDHRQNQRISNQFVCNYDNLRYAIF